MNIGDPGEELTHYGESIVPADPTGSYFDEEGTFEIRTDLNSGDKIGTVRFYRSSSSVDIPIYPMDIGRDTEIDDVVRVQANGEVGFLPIVSRNNAAYPFLSIYHNGSVWGFHDSTTVDTDSDIPDSVVIQNYGTTWDQGDNTWLDDATSDGSQDTTINGGPQASTLPDSSESVNFDGTDDNGALTLPSSLEGSGLNSFAVEFAFQYTSSGKQSLTGIIDGDDQRLRVEINRNQNFNQDDGNILFALQDEGSGQLAFSPSTNPNLDDGQRHDVTIIINDADNNDGEIIIDGSSVGISYGNKANPSNFGTWENDIRVAARYLSGVDFYADVNIGAYRWHDTSISNQTINDY